MSKFILLSLTMLILLFGCVSTPPELPGSVSTETPDVPEIPEDIEDYPVVNFEVKTEYASPEFGFVGLNYSFIGSCTDPNGGLRSCSILFGDETGLELFNESGPVEFAKNFGQLYLNGSFEIGHWYNESGDYTISIIGLDMKEHYTENTFETSVREDIAPYNYIIFDTGFGKFLGNKTNMEIFCSDENGDMVNCTLDFGDGTPIIEFGVGGGSVLEANISHTYNETGEFNVTLKVEDSNGNVDYDFVVVDTRTNEFLDANYKWTFKGEEWTWNPIFNRTLFDYYINKPRPTFYGSRFALYAVDPKDDEIITSLVDLIKESAEENNFTKEDTANFVISFVQSLEYTADDVTTPYDEYPRYPLETLAAEGGDCEDTAILGAVMLGELGYDTVLIDLPGHIAIGVECDKGTGFAYTGRNGTLYCYLESTGTGWQIGQIPDGYRDKKAEILYLDPKPVLSISVKRTFDFTERLAIHSLSVIIRNEGSADAENVTVFLTMDHPDEGFVRDQIRYEVPGVIKKGEETLVIKGLKTPRGKLTRVRVSVSANELSNVRYAGSWFIAG